MKKGLKRGGFIFALGAMFALGHHVSNKYFGGKVTQETLTQLYQNGKFQNQPGNPVEKLFKEKRQQLQNQISSANKELEKSWDKYRKLKEKTVIERFLTTAEGTNNGHFHIKLNKLPNTECFKSIDVALISYDSQKEEMEVILGLTKGRQVTITANVHRHLELQTNRCKVRIGGSNYEIIPGELMGNTEIMKSGIYQVGTHGANMIVRLFDELGILEATYDSGKTSDGIKNTIKKNRITVMHSQELLLQHLQSSADILSGKFKHQSVKKPKGIFENLKSYTWGCIHNHITLSLKTKNGEEATITVTVKEGKITSTSVKASDNFLPGQLLINQEEIKKGYYKDPRYSQYAQGIVAEAVKGSTNLLKN